MITVLGYYALACIVTSIVYVGWRSLSVAVIRRRQIKERLDDLYDDDTALIDFLARARSFEGAE